MSAKDAAAAEIRVETAEEGAVVRVVTVEVPAARVKEAFDRTYKTLSKTARIKGFRPGKTPRSVLVRMYAADAGEEIERQLVNATLPDALELAAVEPVTEPDIDSEPPLDGEAFSYTARVEIRPTIELPDLAGLPAPKADVEVGEDEVQVELDALRERSAPLLEEPEETEAAVGHFLNIDFEGSIDGEAFEGGAGKEVEIEVGAGRFIPGFEAQLIGARSGDKRTVRVQFPEDYSAEQLRGRDAEFAVLVRSLRRKDLPALDDEFAKDMGEDSIEALRDRVRNDLRAGREREARGALHRSLLDALIERTDFPVPAGLVERQLQVQMQSLEQRFSGQVPPDVLRAELARMNEDGRDMAERRVREILLLQAIAEANEIEVTDNEIDERLGELAGGRGIDPAAFREAAREQGWRQSLAFEMHEERVLAFIESRAEVATESGD